MMVTRCVDTVCFVELIYEFFCNTPSVVMQVLQRAFHSSMTHMELKGGARAQVSGYASCRLYTSAFRRSKVCKAGSLPKFSGSVSS